MPKNLARITLPVAGVWFLFAGYWFFFRNGMTLGGFIFTAAGAWMLYQWVRARRR